MNEAANLIADHADEDANIIFGASIDEDMENEQIEVTVIATGFGSEPSSQSSRGEADVLHMPTSFKSFAAAQDVEEEEEDPEVLTPVETHEAFVSKFTAQAVAVAEEEMQPEEVLELENPILEPIETTPQIPSSYRPDEKPGGGRKGRMDSNYDIPTFIRRRSTQFSDE